MAWYNVMRAIEGNEDAQKKGIVVVVYDVGRQGMDDQIRSVTQQSGDFIRSSPMRIVGYHYCYDRPQLRPLFVLAQQFLERSMRLRFREHCGTYVRTCRYIVRCVYIDACPEERMGCVCVGVCVCVCVGGCGCGCVCVCVCVCRYAGEFNVLCVGQDWSFIV